MLHVHDNFGKPTVAPAAGGRRPSMQLIRGEGDLHLPPGWGEVPRGDVRPGGFQRRPIFVLEMDCRFWRDDLDVARASIATGQRLVALAGAATAVATG